MAHPGKGGPEGTALNRLKDLNARRDTNVVISTLIAVDLIDSKTDNMLGKQDQALRKMDLFGSGQMDIAKGVTEIRAMMKEKEGDKGVPKSLRPSPAQDLRLMTDRHFGCKAKE